MAFYLYSDELQHHGIKGMKWGIRKDRKKSSMVSGKKKRSTTTSGLHEDYKKAHDRTSARTMSDAELRARINRLQMEKQYSDLSGADIARGKQVAKTIMKVATTVAAVTTTGLTIYNNVDKIRKIIKK